MKLVKFTYHKSTIAFRRRDVICERPQPAPTPIPIRCTPPAEKEKKRPYRLLKRMKKKAEAIFLFIFRDQRVTIDWNLTPHTHTTHYIET